MKIGSFIGIRQFRLFASDQMRNLVVAVNERTDLIFVLTPFLVLVPRNASDNEELTYWKTTTMSAN